MGWSFEHRDKGTSNLEHFRKAWPETYELLDGATVGGTFYGALRTPEDGVVGVVILTRWVPRDWFNFGEKSMTEDMGPVEARCPVRILDLLTPTTSEYANEWRNRCREYHARVGKVKRGTIIRLSALSADTYEAVDLRRNIFREVGSFGRRVRISWWRTANFEVIPASSTFTTSTKGA